MIGRNSKLVWLALNLVLIVAVGVTLGIGARAVLVECARERDREAQQIRQFVSQGLEWSRGNVRQLRAGLASLPLGASFAALEIRGKSGTLLDIRYDAPSAPPAWASALPPLAPAVLELPLDNRNSQVLRLVPASFHPASRLAQAIYPALAGGAAAILVANLFCWILSRRTRKAWIERAHWESAVSPQRPAEAPADAEKSMSRPERPPDGLERCPEAIVVCDAERRVSYANAVARSLFRHTPAIAPGGAVLELIAPWDRARFAEALAVREPEEAARTVRLQALTAQGGIRPVDVAIGTLAAGEPALILSLRDAGAAQSLETGLALRDRLLDMLPQGLAIVSPRDHGEILYCNRAFRSLLRSSSGLPDRATLPGVLVEGAEDGVVRSVQAAVEKIAPLDLSLTWHDSALLDIRLVPLSPGSVDAACLAVIVCDRTQEAAARERVERELALNRAILDEMPLGLCVADAEGKALAVNARLAELTGRTRSQLMDSALEEWLPRDAKTKGRILYGEFAVEAGATSKTVKINTLKLPAPASGGEYVYFFDDVTLLRQQAQTSAEEAERLQLTLDGIAEGIITTNPDGFIQYLNPHARQLTGLDGHEYVGMPIGKVLRLTDEKKRRPLADPVLRAMRIGKTIRFRQDVLLLSEGKPELAVEISATPIFDRKQTLLGGVVVLKDVSEQRLLARQMQMRASRDPLTGLVNRRELLSVLESLQYEVDEHHRQHSLCYMDLDKFKIVNDSCGHPAGDELLRQMSRLMGECLRSQDILARIGGDEFCAVLPNTRPEDARSVAERIRESVKSFRFSWDGKYFEIGISIGIVGLKPGLGVEENLGAADQACYEAKERGRDLVYVSVGREQEGDKLVPAPWHERLLEALEHDYFHFSFRDACFLHENPRSAPGYREILLQLREPERMPLVASAFMPNAQRSNLVPAIERWAISKLFSLPRQPGDAHVCAIPLSAATLSENGFVSFLSEQSERHRVPPSSICFEIAENDLVQNYSLVQDFISKGRAQGYRFCLSQFGGGVSSFAYIRNLPLDFLKIDDSLTYRVEIDDIDEAIVSAIQNIAEHMNILTIAQNVNGRTLLERLRTLGIHYAQGAAVLESRSLS
ncbi:diguanylate cyclase [Methylocaldum sp. MU1018]